MKKKSYTKKKKKVFSSLEKSLINKQTFHFSVSEYFVSNRAP